MPRCINPIDSRRVLSVSLRQRAVSERFENAAPDPFEAKMPFRPINVRAVEERYSPPFARPAEICCATVVRSN